MLYVGLIFLVFPVTSGLFAHSNLMTPTNINQSNEPITTNARDVFAAPPLERPI